MAKKTFSQLRKEIQALKKRDAIKQKIILKKQKEIMERKKLEKELKELKRSPIYKKLKGLSKKRLTAKQKANIKKGGKKAVTSAAQATKSTWKTLGKIVNKLDKINI